MHLFTHSRSPSEAGTMWTLCFQALCASFRGRRRGGSGNKDLRRSWSPGPLLPLLENSLAQSFLVRPWGWHMAPSHLPKKENQPPTQERTRSLSPGRGSLRGKCLFPKVNEEPALSLPPHLRHPFSWRSRQQPLGREQRGPAAPACGSAPAPGR